MAPSPSTVAVARASRRWARSFPLAPRYRPPALPLRLRSADRTRLSAVWAGEPKAVWWLPGGGHGRSMLTPELLDRVRVEVSERLAPVPSPGR